MNSVTINIIIILLLIAANGVFAMAEIGLISAKKIRLQQKEEDGDRGASIALELSENPNRFLSTVQIGITLIGILSGAFGGATIAEAIAASLNAVPLLAPYGKAIGLGIVVLITTYLSLVFGELVPKRIAMNSAERVATLLAPAMNRLSALTGPVVSFLSYSTEFILRLFGVHGIQEPLVTEEEVKMMIQQGTETGVFDKVENDMVKRVFRLGDRRVSALMTPRPEIVWLDLEDSFETNLEKIQTTGYSRYPVCTGDLDHLHGLLNVKDLWGLSIHDQPIDLMTLANPPLYIPETMTALELLDRFKKSSRKTAIVIDEFGGVSGFIRINDLLDSIIGPMAIEDEGEEPEVTRREDGSFLIDGTFLVDDLKDLLDLKNLPDEEERNYETIAGFILAMLGVIPTSGDHFEWNGWHFEVIDMDGHRIDKVLVNPTAENS